MPLIYVDRSRYVTGLSHCMMARFNEYHDYGTGYRRNSFSVPLATGTYTHQALEGIAIYCKGLQELGDLTPLDILQEVEKHQIVRAEIERAIEDYQKHVDETDIRSLTEYPEDVDKIVTEQCFLLAGLVWTWVKKALPWVLEKYDIIAVEQEYECVIACTCGLAGAGSVDVHEERGCNGVVLMSRPDLLLRNRETGKLAYVEFKTGADVMKKNYAMQYEDNIQFCLSSAAAAIVLGEEITELYVHALNKGKRGNEYNPITREYDGPVKQDSPFCYGYFKEANPPMVPEELLPRYWNKDKMTGKRWGATENRGWKKYANWEAPFVEIPEGMPPYEYVVRMLEKLEDDEFIRHINFIGPITPPQFLIDRLLVEVAAEERRWAERVDYLTDILADCDGDRAHPDYQQALSEIIPRSWDCYRYGGWCGYQHTCFQKEGWEDPLSLDKYIRRTPNHPIELRTGHWEEIDV